MAKVIFFSYANVCAMILLVGRKSRMKLSRWSPVTGLAAVEVDRLNRMFDHMFTSEPWGEGHWAPVVDIYETANKDVVVKAELPDMKREDIKITFENNVVTIEGERKFADEPARD